MKRLMTLTAAMIVALGSSGLVSADTQTEAKMEQRLMQDMQQQQEKMKLEQKQYRHQNQYKNQYQHKQSAQGSEAAAPMVNKEAMGSQRGGAKSGGSGKGR